MPLLNRHNWHEPAAYVSSSLAVITGALLGFSCDPDWLGRAGSVVICVGVLLAASRKVDRTEEAIAMQQRQFKEAMRPHVAGVLRETTAREPTWAEINVAEAEIESNVPDTITPLLKRKRRALRMHEVSLVVLGTLINGFGSWLIRSAA